MTGELAAVVLVVASCSHVGGAGGTQGTGSQAVLQPKGTSYRYPLPPSRSHL